MLRIAHRGASGYEQENSMKAFHKAIELGVDIIELDIQQTSDGKFVIFHDHYLDRCTNSSGRISELTLDLIDHRVRLKNGDKIPHLEEVCSHLKKNNAVALFELKNDYSAEKVFEIINSIVDPDNFIIGSFFHKQILELKNKIPNAITCLMFESLPVNLYEYLMKTKVNYAAVGFESTNQKLISTIKSASVKALVWTLNESREIKLAHKYCVDGIISNFPDRI